METNEKDNNIEPILPEGKYWFTLREACQLKNLNYKTSTTRPWLQPNGGKGERIGGKKCFRREVIAAWLPLSDSQIVGEEPR